MSPLQYLVLELGIVTIGGACVVTLGLLLDRRRHREWGDGERLVLYYGGPLRVALAAGTVVFTFALVALASYEPADADDRIPTSAFAFTTAMALLGAGAWYHAGRRVVIDARSIRSVPRFGRTRSIAWTAVESARWVGADLMLRGSGCRIRVAHTMVGFAALTAWLERYLPAGVSPGWQAHRARLPASGATSAAAARRSRCVRP